MDSELRYKMLSRLQMLAASQQSFYDTHPGVPFVVSEREFGIECGITRGFVYAVNHMIESLERGGFFEEGVQAYIGPEDLFAKVGIGENIEIYPGAVLQCSEDGMTLNIQTEKNSEAVMAALQKCVEENVMMMARQEEHDREIRDEVSAEFVKEKIEPLFDEATDIAFVTEYLARKTSTYLDIDRKALLVNGPIAPTRSEMSLCSFPDITDDRPKFEVRISPEVGDKAYLSHLCNRELTPVFTGYVAVTERMARPNQPRCYELRGSPARLARDIIERDPGLAADIAADMGKTVPSISTLWPRKPTNGSAARYSP